MLVVATFLGISMVVVTAMPYSNDISDLRRYGFVSKKSTKRNLGRWRWVVFGFRSYLFTSIELSLTCCQFARVNLCLGEFGINATIVLFGKTGKA